jgi:hypothetical protein
MGVRPLGRLALVGRAVPERVVDADGFENEDLVLDVDVSLRL